MRTIAFALLALSALSPCTASASSARADRVLAAAQERLAAIERRAQAQQDERAIENLQRIYGYYLDRGEWDQVADLFAADGTIEFEQRGVYVGKDRIRRFLDLLGPAGLREGHLDDRLQLQIVVHVAPDGRTATLRARELNMGGDVGGSNHLAEGTYENALVKEGGVWKFKSVHYYANLKTDFDKGFGEDARPIDTASAALPPDLPPSEAYRSYPAAHVAPFRQPNPVTGDPVQYKGEFE